METLTANASGILKNASGDTPSWTLVPGSRYAFVLRNATQLTAGTVIPGQGTSTTVASYFPSSAADAATVMAYTMGGSSAAETKGFEFAATGTTFILESSGFTENDAVNVSLTRIED